MKLQQNMRMCLKKNKSQRREERAGEQEQQREREGSKRARQDLIHSLTPDRPPLVAITGN